MSSKTAPDYSTLEVNENRWLEAQHNSAPEVTHNPQDEKILAGWPEEGGRPMKSPTICGLQRKTFWIALAITIIIVAAAGVGGGVGGGIAAHRKNNNRPSGSEATPPSSTTTGPAYQNTGLAAIQWTDQSGTNHYRVYYQDKFNVSQVSGSTSNVKPATPIAAAAGYPHANYSYALVKNVYYMSSNDELYERQAPSNNSNAWENDNFSGLYSGTNDTSLAAYWHQNMNNQSQELVVLFQESDFANGLTMGKYTSNITSSYPWVANKFGFSTPHGSSFALSPTGAGQDVLLYSIDNDGKFMQHEYTLSDDLNPGIISSTSTDTGLTLDSRSPLAVVSQDNTPLFSQDLLPECSKSRPLTHLIVYALPDRSSLNLNSWNCTDGFVNFTSQIQPLLKPSTTYLALASHQNGKLYVMFDQGSGPEIEEWTAPHRSGDPWSPVRNVTAKFSA